MSDYAVLLTVGPTMLQYLVYPKATLHMQLPLSVFFMPSDGSSAHFSASQKLPRMARRPSEPGPQSLGFKSWASV